MGFKYNPDQKFEEHEIVEFVKWLLKEPKFQLQLPQNVQNWEANYVKHTYQQEKKNEESEIVQGMGTLQINICQPIKFLCELHLQPIWNY